MPMWDTIRLIATQWGLPGILILCIGFFIYIVYIDKVRQVEKDTAREIRLNQMTDKVINITAEVSTVVSANTEVFREVSQRLIELKETNIIDHKFIITKLEKLDDDIEASNKRLEDKIDNIKFHR